MNMHSELIVDISDLNLGSITELKLLPFAGRRDNPILVDLTGSQSLKYAVSNFGVLNEHDIGFMSEREDYLRILDTAESQYNTVVFGRPKHSSYMYEITAKVNARILSSVLKLYNKQTSHNNELARSTIKVKE